MELPMSWFKQKRIVVPFDFSDASLEAVRVALKLAPDPDDVHVLHVLAELPAGDPYVVWDDMSDAKRMEASRKSMTNKLGELETPVRNIHLDVGIGNAGNVIADLAESIGAGLIVIPSHGRTGVKRFLLGSVAERVVRLAKCPVLVLKKSDSHG
jgi:nucleotide-binding universal stress UspA family protein